MKEKGLVVSRNYNKAEVVFIRKSACGENCVSCGQCSTCEHKATVSNNIGANTGDIVNVYISDKSSYLSLILVFLVPVIILISSYVLAFSLFKNATLSAIISVALCIIYFVIIKAFDKKIAPLPEICEIINE